VRSRGEGRILLPSRVVFLGLLGAYAGQAVFFPVLPPLCRELGLGEGQAGLLVSVTALAWLAASPFWGRASDRWGRRPVFLVGLVGYALGSVLFAAAAQAGLGGAIAAATLFALLFLARAVAGLLASAAPPAALAYVADTTDEARRTGGTALLAAASGLGFLLGPAAGGALAGWGLLVPIYLSGALALAGALLAWFALPESHRRVPAGAREGAPPRRVGPLDARVLPFLVAGVALTAALSAAQTTAGFYFQDVLSLHAEEAARSVGLALTASGLAAVVVQVLLVQRFAWPPRVLLSAGLPAAVLGFLALAFAQGFAPLLAAFALLGAGFGLALPGYTAAPTLAAGPDEQGAVAGLTGAASGLGIVLGPLAGTGLYGLGPAYPYLLCAGVLALVFVLVAYAFRRTAPANRADAVPLGSGQRSRRANEKANERKEPAMTTTANQEANKDLLRRYHEAWSEGDLDALRDFFSPDYVDRDLVSGDARGGLEEAKAPYLALRAAFPDVRVELEDLVAEGEKVAVFGVMRATHTGAEFMGVPPGGARVAVPGIGIYRIVDGKIAETWRLTDMMTLVRQLGAAPAR
jgi:steroid delta-isomerase-like uncharacterized protein